MSYYDPQSPASWQQNPRPGWDPRSAVSTPGHATYSKQDLPGQSADLSTRFTQQMKPEDPSAFGSQLDEVDRAVDNLVKSGKMFTAPRRDSMPMMGAGGPRGFPVEQHASADNRLVAAMPVRHYSVPDFEAMRSPSAANLQNFYATQRFQARPQAPQQSPAAEPETVLQAKRRAAAQRERELRNYHQEQQYNRTVLAEINTFEDGNHLDDNSRNNLSVNPNGASAPASNAGGTRVHTPATELPPNGVQNSGAVSPNHARASSGSPSVSGSFSLSGNANAGVQGFSNRTSASSPGGSPPRSQRGSVAPIGTRPTSQALNNAKRATTPLASPLSYGFGNSESDPFSNLSKERSASAASAASAEQHSGNNNNGNQNPDGLTWSKVWGPGNKGLTNVASVWG